MPNLPPPTGQAAVTQPDEADGATDPAAPVASVAPTGRPLRPTLRGTAPAARFARTAAQPTLDPATEYRYVVRDLRQIGLLALIAFVVLGALSQLIR
jgi:hypothetical protein